MTEIQNRLKLTAPLSAMKAGKVAMSPGEDDLIGIPFPEHSSELLSSLNAQRRAGLLCDLTLTSRGARYPTHRSVMAAVSLYFRRLFVAEEGGGGEGGEVGGGGGGFSVCQLDCVAPDALDALLEFAYTATLTIRNSGMRDVLRGAQLLGIQCVADACRDILGEKGEAEGEVVYHTERAKASRRKKDKRKLTRVESHHTNEKREPSPPPPHPSPVQDSTRSLPPSRSPSRPPSPRQEDHPPTAGQNGERRRGKMPGRGAMVNGGVPQERVLGPPPPPSDDHLSEDEDMKGLGNGGVLGSTSTCSMAEQGEVVAGAGGAGRKRKSQTPQQCPVCQKIIHGAGKLPRHMRTHTGEKPFQCSACGVRFTRNDKLKIHMRKHTGERPYPCPHCPARFLHSYDLKNHLSLHSGVRPFECPLCHKAFAREDHLMRHRKGHSCLELRTRKPRRGAGHGEEGRGGGGRGAGGRGSAPDELDSLEPHPLQPQPSAFLGHGVAVQGDRSGAQLLEAARERSLALQALTFLEAHRQPYPHLTWRGPELGVGRRVEEEAGGAHSPALQHARWAEVEEEEEELMGEEDEEEDEED